MRDKLIELLKESKLCSRRFDDQYSDGTIAIIADHLIANGVTVQKWIPVSERLLEEDVRVLVRIDQNSKWHTEVELDTDRRHKNSWVRWGEAITHWMPLPEPPKEVE